MNACHVPEFMSSEEKEEKKENGNGKAKTLLGSSHSEKIGISLVDDDVGIVFKVRADAIDSCFGISLVDGDVCIVFKVRAMP